tara:strand:- start:4605 stop:4844 length:240 start_codon:yes stop_codon:yes gene_type:complete
MNVKILKIIDIRFFLLAFFIGLIYIYYENDKRIIYVYPTLHNYNDLEYHDKADNCFSYNLKKIKCPKNKSNINNIPIQE